MITRNYYITDRNNNILYNNLTLNEANEIYENDNRCVTILLKTSLPITHPLCNVIITDKNYN